VFLVVGLGNPGREYEGHRHNIGFRVVDAIRERGGWPDYKAKFGGVWTRGSLGGEAVALLKPQGYMNLSGDSVQPAAAFLKVRLDHVIVVHDELDLVWKDIRIKAGGGHAGHNGVRSIIERLGDAGFVRVRVGIGSPARGDRDAADWVLSNFDPVERAESPKVVSAAALAVRDIIDDGVAKAMNRVNTGTRA
jgi:PTH1 family peptidyl-tRNA hydrolase